jgi:hypothetical protein
MIEITYSPIENKYEITANNRTHRGRNFPVARRILRALGQSTVQAEVLLALAFVKAFIHR